MSLYHDLWFVQVIANTAAISLEDVIPVGVSSSATVAPEQVAACGCAVGSCVDDDVLC